MLVIFLVGASLVASISAATKPCAVGDVPTTCIVNPYCMPQIAQGCANTLSDGDCDQIFTNTYFKDFNLVDLKCNDTANHGQAIKGCPKACGACCQDPAFSCTNPGGKEQCSTFAAAQCSDPNLKEMLQDRCPALCGTCPTTPGCVDTASINCAQYAGYCYDSTNEPPTVAPSPTTKVAPVPSGTCGNNPNCATWIRNKSFCTNTFYSYAQRMSYCGIPCRMCTGK